MSSHCKVIPRSALQRPCVWESHLCVSANIKKTKKIPRPYYVRRDDGLNLKCHRLSEP